ncbi:metalloregulator ArsR/SmtB family transcription factor [Tissierella carlieri]|uniref:Metalloregulator ArsR/SmtB family transcription factor n=1 Tax=Tissierella carlieri TaxID=689904 RepID=A0ABT1SGR0_9FIRM|nr:metalloregulator ArsR/SmtB family transcription factor [Tissierella carlieri]MBU5310672.1 metalloregulator ArsR/SmtB family transcription factor [Tissierella carlieri]MCQ4925685.1 metalloregulator ArsR/SmtB family transcription factor [Tissierella carlieri]
MNSLEIFKCLADNSRLRIINNLMIEPMYVELLAERLDLSTSTVSFHLKKLMEANIVSCKKEQYYAIYSLNEKIFSMNLKDLIKDNRNEEEMLNQREQKYKGKVIESFFKYNKLKEIPVQKKKKQIILEKIVESFERDRTYTEKEVNLIIADFHDDFCTIRRDLVGFNLMERKDGIYKRI